MEDPRNLETSELVDLLAEQTEIYLKINSQGASEEEYVKCNLMIKALQKELDQRKNSKISSARGTPLDFS